MKRALVTGLTGFTGRYLDAHVRSLDYEVVGLGPSAELDIRDADGVAASVRASRADVVFHLAAAPRHVDPADLYAVSVVGTRNLLDAVASLERPPAVLVVSSSAIYGRTRPGRPVSERVQPRPLTHYGVAKLAQEEVALRYARAVGLRVVVARAFNLLGPGLPPDLACGAFARGIAEIERHGGPLMTGRLDSRRDFIDVRDAVRAYVLLAEQGRSGVAYNVCSGTAVSLRRCVEILSGLTASPITVQTDPARLQRHDLVEQVGDGRRLRRRTGWEPTTTIERSLADMLDHERRSLSG